MSSNIKYSCLSCCDELNENELGITCIQGHSMCNNGCSSTFKDTILQNPNENIPLKCPICKTDIIGSTFERQLNPKEYQLFLLYSINKDPTFIDKNTEEIVSCPYCNYWEINEINDGRMMIYCKNNKCKTVSCYNCKKSMISNNNDSDSKSETKVNANEFENHYECARLHKAKAIWDKALENGVKRVCPECGLGGIKNDSCMFVNIFSLYIVIYGYIFKVQG